MKIVHAEFVTSTTSYAHTPSRGEPVFAFLGRSNVGKSSLINMLLQRKKMAKTSSAPGKTAIINYFLINKSWYIVDLPGYGWAKVSKKERDSWGRLVEGYLAGRRELKLAIVLQDIRRSWSEDESLLLQWLAQQDVPGRVVLTKTDKLKLMKRKERIRALMAEIGEGFGKPISTSAQKGDGLDLVWKLCCQHAFPRDDDED